jgi:branched-chain amino acid transport system permease protein
MTPRALCAIALALAVAFPFCGVNEFYVNIASQILIYGLLAMSLNILVGFGGLTSLGHAVYLGLGAYICAWLTLNAGWPPLAAAVAALIGGTAMAAFFGVLALRASGLGFLMITLALGQIVWGVAYRWASLTNGENGLRLPERPAPFGLSIATPAAFYVFMLVTFAIGFFMIRRLQQSPYGACLRGTRDQPRRMRMLGHNVWLIRWAAFVLAGFWGSVAGLAYIYYNQFISPHALALQQSAEALLMVILGGAGTLTGPLVGAIVVTLTKNVLSSYVDRWSMLLGFIFVITVVFMPKGIVPGLVQLAERRQKAPAAGPSLAPSAEPHR